MIKTVYLYLVNILILNLVNLIFEYFGFRCWTEMKISYKEVKICAFRRKLCNWWSSKDSEICKI